MFDNIPSETYGLYISYFGGGGVDNSSGGSDIDIIKQKLSRKSNYFIQGVEQSAPLEFELSVMSVQEITRDMLNSIQKWLFGQMGYKKLQIIQGDLSNVYFNCFLKSPDIIAVGNVAYGLKFKVECDAPWGWERDANYAVGAVVTTKAVKYYNSSDDNHYIYPTLSFQKNGAGNLSIKNTTDNNNEIVFTGLQANDIIVVNNDLQIMTSTAGDNLLSKSNLKWFRLLNGYNDIVVTGNLTYLNIAHKVARKVGS